MFLTLFQGEIQMIVKKRLVLSVLFLVSNVFAADMKLLNVSYDPTRELYQAINPLFIQAWKEKTGKSLEIQQSHGGSGKQARSVIDGLRADVVTLALAYDIDMIANSGKLPTNWQSLYPENSAPFYSTVVFVVRKGNPKQIKDWDDIVKDDVKVITPNPKTSGGARWNHLAAWAFAIEKYKTEEKAKEFIRKLYKNVPVLDTGARGASMSFVERGMGDVLLAWENEAYLLAKEHPDKVEIITPTMSIKAQPPVAVVDKVAEKNGVKEAAQAYLSFLYTAPAQRLAAQNYYRPTDKSVNEEFAARFPNLKLLSFEALFGNWSQAHLKHFQDGGTFDEALRNKPQ